MHGRRERYAWQRGLVFFPELFVKGGGHVIWEILEKNNLFVTLHKRDGIAGNSMVLCAQFLQAVGKCFLGHRSNYRDRAPAGLSLKEA